MFARCVHNRFVRRFSFKKKNKKIVVEVWRTRTDVQVVAEFDGPADDVPYAVPKVDAFAIRSSFFFGPE